MSIANHALPTYKLDMKKCHDWITHNSIINSDLGVYELNSSKTRINDVFGVFNSYYQSRY